MRGRGVLVGLLAAGVLGGLAAGCTKPVPHAVIDVDAPVALADQPVHLRVSGLPAGTKVEVSAEADDYRKKVWRSHATFTADGGGAVDLDHAAPASGTYTNPDGMGLFWSMGPPTGDADKSQFSPPFPFVASTFQVRLTATVDGRQVARRTLTREWLASGVTHRTLDLGKDKAVGELYLPPPGGPKRPGVLMFSGSGGGVGDEYEAALVASHGYPALALAYFNAPGLPATLNDIPLEYFASAARLLAAQPGAAPGAVAAVGYSRGSEAALLLAEHYPDLVHATVVYGPSSVVVDGFPNGGNAWTFGGAPVPQETIPVDRVRGPVLAIAGTEDAVWGSARSAKEIMAGLDAAHLAFPHQALVYPGAGHGVGTFPYLAEGTAFVHPVTGAVLLMGGSRPADAAARRDGWPKVLAMLATVS